MEFFKMYVKTSEDFLSRLDDVRSIIRKFCECGHGHENAKW